MTHEEEGSYVSTLIRQPNYHENLAQHRLYDPCRQPTSLIRHPCYGEHPSTPSTFYASPPPPPPLSATALRDSPASKNTTNKKRRRKGSMLKGPQLFESDYSVTSITLSQSQKQRQGLYCFPRCLFLAALCATLLALTLAIIYILGTDNFRFRLLLRFSLLKNSLLKN